MNEVCKILLLKEPVVTNTNQKRLKKEDIDLIVKAGLAAPSGGNRQPWRMVVVTNE